MRLSRDVLEILSLIFQTLKRSRDNDHGPFSDNLSKSIINLVKIEIRPDIFNSLHLVNSPPFPYTYLSSLPLSEKNNHETTKTSRMLVTNFKG